MVICVCVFIDVNLQTCTCRSQNASTQSCCSKGLTRPPCLFCLSFLVLFVCSFSSSLLSLFLFPFSVLFLLSLLGLLSLLFLVCFLVFSFSCPLGGVWFCRSFDCSLVSVLRIHEFCLPHIDALLMCRFVHCSAVPCLHSPTVTSTVVARALAPHKLALLPFYRDDRFPHT